MEPERSSTKLSSIRQQEELLPPSVAKKTNEPPTPTLSSSSSKQEVYEWAKRLLEKEGINSIHADILLNNEVTGKVLLTLTKAELLAPPYNMLGGPATTLSLAIEELKGSVKKGIILREV